MKHQINNKNIPDYVTRVTETIQNAGFESFLVGGCVRDLIIGRKPKDWDITTNAKPEEIINLFEKTVYENDFGTVGVCIPKEGDVTRETSENKINSSLNSKSGVTRETLPGGTDLKDLNKMSVTRETIKSAQFLMENDQKDVTRVTKYHIIEVTPYRIEAEYTDFRHPDEVVFSDSLEEDLKRRDFTINAMAYDPHKRQLIDIYKGQDDIKDKTIRAVGDAENRFNEDALRMLRAVRFSSELGFIVSHETVTAILAKKDLIKSVSFERVRDEFTKIIMSDNPVLGVGFLEKLGLMKHIIPEIQDSIDCKQGGAHKYDVFGHLLAALDHAKDKGWGLEIRLAALFHDIGKPKSRRPGVKKAYTFYGHEVVGEKMTRKIMERLKYPKKTVELVVSLVRNHMFFSDTELITISAVRRIVQKVGEDHIWDLMNVRECDRVGMAKPEAPYRLRKYHAMIDEVLRDPISVGQLAIDGNFLMKELHVKPGPRMGWILNAMLEEVLDDPTKNTKEYLGELAKSLGLLEDKELKILGEKAKEKKEEIEEREVEELRKKHGVK